MLANRYFRFLISIISFAIVFGVLFIIEFFNLFEFLFPNLKELPDGVLWMSTLTTFCVSAAGQLLGDIMNVDKWLNNGFVTFIKRAAFVCVFGFMLYWYGSSFFVNLPTNNVSIFEGAFTLAGFIGPIFVFSAYLITYICDPGKKKWFPFFFIFSYASAVLFCGLMAAILPPLIIVGALAALVIPIIACFKSETWPFTECNVPAYMRRGEEDLSYLDNPHYRPGNDDDYDERGHYVGAKCKNCAYYKPYYDKYGLCQPYCTRGNSGSCHEYGYCRDYRR